MTNGHFDSCRGIPPCNCEIKRYGAIFALGLLILLVEILGGLWSGSLALLADAGHVFIDNSALLVGMATALLVNKYQAREHRIRAFGGYVNAFLMAVIAVWIFVEAISRFNSPHEIVSLTMIAFAAIGGVGNYAQHAIMELVGDHHNHVTHQSVRLHVLSDLWQSVAVVIGGIAMFITEKTWIDSVLSVCISVIMGYWAIKLVFLSKKTRELHLHDHGHHH